MFRANWNKTLSPLGVEHENKKTRTKYLAIHYGYGLAIINCEYYIMEVKEYGVKKSWDGYRTYANVQDGKYLMPINWANELFKTKQQAKTFIEDLAKKNGWKK
jgi:hypothetical protein